MLWLLLEGVLILGLMIPVESLSTDDVILRGATIPLNSTLWQVNSSPTQASVRSDIDQSSPFLSLSQITVNSSPESQSNRTQDVIKLLQKSTSSSYEHDMQLTEISSNKKYLESTGVLENTLTVPVAHTELLLSPTEVTNQGVLQMSSYFTNSSYSADQLANSAENSSYLSWPSVNKASGRTTAIFTSKSLDSIGASGLEQSSSVPIKHSTAAVLALTPSVVLLSGVIFSSAGISSREGGSVVSEILRSTVAVDVSVYLVSSAKSSSASVSSMEIGMMSSGTFSFGSTGDESSYGLASERSSLMASAAKSSTEFSVSSKEELRSSSYVKFSSSPGNVQREESVSSEKVSKKSSHFLGRDGSTVFSVLSSVHQSASLLSSGGNFISFAVVSSNQFISSIEESMSPTPSQVSSVVIYMKLRFNFPGEVIRPFHKLI